MVSRHTGNVLTFILYSNMMTKRIREWENAKREYSVRRNSIEGNFPCPEPLKDLKKGKVIC